MKIHVLKLIKYIEKKISIRYAKVGKEGRESCNESTFPTLFSKVLLQLPLAQNVSRLGSLFSVVCSVVHSWYIEPLVEDLITAVSLPGALMPIQTHITSCLVTLHHLYLSVYFD